MRACDCRSDAGARRAAAFAAIAQWLDVGPVTSTNTAAPSPGITTSNTLVYGMDAQGSPVYGAANVILQSPTDPNAYWAATVSGGIWKTTNGGATWTPTTDHQPTLAFGAITIDTADPAGKTMYAASGYYSAGAVNDAPQTILLKSVDGGSTWQAIKSTGIENLYLDSGGFQFTDSAPASIKNIIAMGNVILVAAGGSRGHDSLEQAGGLYRGVDGGQTFTQVPTLPGTEITSLVSTTINNQTVLLAAANATTTNPTTASITATMPAPPGRSCWGRARRFSRPTPPTPITLCSPAASAATLST